MQFDSQYAEAINRAAEAWKSLGDVSPKGDPYIPTSNMSDAWRITIWSAYHHGLTRLPRLHKSRGDSWIIETATCYRLKVKMNYKANDHREYVSEIGYA